jgi:hypothetical protein
MDPATKASLVARLPEARLMTAAYDLCAGEGNNLTPAVPADFPWPAGFEFRCHLNVSDQVLLFFKETSYMGLLAESVDEFLLVPIGTHNWEEWFEDMEANPRGWTSNDGCACSVETGFLRVYQETSLTAPFNMPLTAWMSLQASSGKPLRIVCHSLSAAFGRLVAADAFQPHLTAFAAPKGGDIVLERHLQTKLRPGSVEIRNVQDAIPQAPPFPLYRSLLPGIFFNSDEYLNSGDLGDRHRMPTCYLPACTP